jgi:hypothetical protein
VVEKIEIHILGPVPFPSVHCMILKTNKNCGVCTCLNSCSHVRIFVLKSFVCDRFCTFKLWIAVVIYLIVCCLWILQVSLLVCTCVLVIMFMSMLSACPYSCFIIINCFLNTVFTRMQDSHPYKTHLPKENVYI